MMIELLKIVIIIFLNIFVYWTLGELVCRVFHLDSGILEKEIAGFFLYYALFQLVAIPCILAQLRVHILVKLWMIPLLAVLGMGIYFLEEKKGRKGSLLPDFSKGLALLVLAIIALEFYYIARNGYNGWDTAYYIGTMNTALKTDTMYIFNGNDGTREAVLDLRYALSGFYMHGVVLCRIWKLHVLLYAHYVTPAILVFLSNAVLFEIGKALAGSRGFNYALGFVLLAGILQFSFVSSYSTSEFLLTRGAEAKGYCANVIIPTVFLIALHFRKVWNSRKYWVLLFLLCAGCDAVSFSSVLLVPTLITVICSAVFAVKRERGIWWRYAVTMVIPAIYAGVYFAFSVNLLTIRVR